MALGQDVGPYTDPVTGYTIISDEQAYRDASEALVTANSYIAELVALANAYQEFFTQASGAGYDVSPDLITMHATVLTEQQAAEQNQAALREYVDRYRYYTLGSGMRGLGGLGALFVVALIGAAVVAGAIGYFVYRKFNKDEAVNLLKSNTLDYQRWLAQQVEAGLLDAQTAQTMAEQATRTVEAAGGGWSLGGLFTGTAGIAVVVVGGLLVLSFFRSR